MNTSEIVAKIALEMPQAEHMSRADVLHALTKAVQAGHDRGFAEGCAIGQKHMSSILDMTMKALA